MSVNESLETYLTDHLAGSEGALSLIGRWKQQASDPAIREFLQDLEAEIIADVRSLEAVRDRVAVASGTLKRAGGWIAEKLSRLKLPAASGESELFSLFESLEVLAIGILGKRALWAMLARLSDSEPRLDGIDFVLLEDRAVEQHQQVERYRLAVGARALVTSSSETRR